MKPGWLRFAYLKHLSQPAKDRPLFRLLDGGTISSLTEFGLGEGVRMRRMLEVVLAHFPAEKVRYAGFDLFEARPAGSPGLTLKQAHRELTAKNIQVRLVPGDFLSGLIRAANTLPRTDLIVISREVDHQTLDAAWFYMPRMLHEHSVVMLESGNVRPEFQALSFAQVQELSRRAASFIRRAA